MKNISLLSILLCFAFLGYIPLCNAQNNDATLQAKAQQYANEVFQDCSQYAQSQYIASYTEVLSRVEIVTTATYSSNDYTLLSTVPLKNKCNANLVHDDASNFNPDNFNPLKYQIDWYPKQTDKAYRVDNTNYIIIIHHVN